MSSVRYSRRKASDEDIIKLNSLGLSLTTIGKILGCHPTAVTNRLKTLGIEPADTRRSFMEEVLNHLNDSQKEWLADQLGPHHTIKDYIRSLLVKEFVSHSNRA